MSSQYTNLPPSGGAASANPSVGTNGAPAPGSSTEVGFIDGSGNLQGVSPSNPLPVTIESEPGAPFHVIVDSSALPTGAATAANQATMETTLAAIEANQTNGTQETIIVGTVPLPTGAATAANQTTEIADLASIVTNTTGLATATAQTTGNTSLATIVTLDSDLAITGQGTQTTLNNNIILASAGTTSTPADNFRSASVQINSSGTGGAYIFEGCNDNTNFITIPVYNQLILTGTPITAAVTATAVNTVYIFPITMNFIRCRISTAITGGSLQAFTRLSTQPWIPPVLQVAQNTAANLATTATVASGTITTVTTVAAVTKANSSFPVATTDIASAAIVTTTTSATITPTFGSSYNAVVNVTAGAGTGTFQVAIQELMDAAADWQTVYTYPATVVTASVVGANALQQSPVITMTGSGLRYVQTLTGVTSITRTVTRNQSSQAGFHVPTQGILTDNSNSVPTSSSQLMAANPQRKYLLLQNPGTVTVWFNFTNAATLTQPSYQLPAGGSFVQEANFVTTESVNVIAASTGAITAKQA